ncbi:MAG: hypothetical protein R3C01_04495 [Planctomycetaceae bacterium]
MSLLSDNFARCKESIRLRQLSVVGDAATFLKRKCLLAQLTQSLAHSVIRCTHQS